MNQERDLSVVKSILPIVVYDISLDSNEIESFQNAVIRPILKFQNELLNKIVLERMTTLHKKFESLSDEEQITLLLINVKKDTALRDVIFIVFHLFPNS